MVTVIDYGVGNISAIANVYNRLGIEIKIAKTKEDLDFVQRIILPGVGSFDHAMQSLNNSGLRDRLDHLVLTEKIPVLGICVGMQMMANKSEEGTMEGLGWIDADVCKFDATTIQHQTKLPHMGWNDVKITNSNPLFAGLENESAFYFLHSYYFSCHNSENSIAVSQYGVPFESAINSQNIFGIQFHPEKSHRFGEILLNNFSNI